MHAAVVGVYFPDLLVAVVKEIESVANAELWQRVYFAVEELFRHVCKVVGGNALYLRSEKLFAPIPFSIITSAQQFYLYRIMSTGGKTYFNWSGGKDSALALYHTLKAGTLRPDLLLTSVNTAVDRISMHGVRSSLLDMQAASIGLPLQKLQLPEGLGMTEYNDTMRRVVTGLVEKGYTETVFGDIFLEDLRLYREQQLAPVGIRAHFPLWKRDTTELLHEFLDLGFRTVLVCIKSELLDASFAGREIDRDFIKDLPKNVDPCGENGEFHTFVFDGPIFSRPIDFTIGEKVYREYARPKDDADNCAGADDKPQSGMGFWYCDLLPAGDVKYCYEKVK